MMHTSVAAAVIWSVSGRSEVTGGFTGRSSLRRHGFVPTVLFKHCQRWGSVTAADGWDRRFYKSDYERVCVCVRRNVFL